MAHLEVIAKQVDELERHDLVEPAASPWASNPHWMPSSVSWLNPSATMMSRNVNCCLWFKDVQAIPTRTTFCHPHAGLQWLRMTPEPMGKLDRWLTFIEQFTFEGRRRGMAMRMRCPEGRMRT